MSKKSLHPEQIKKLLNRSVAQIEPHTLAQLRDARSKAMACYEARSRAPALVWAVPSSSIGWASNMPRKYYYWLAAIVFTACLFSGAAYWQHSSERDTSDVDIAILTDELPIHVYVD